MREQCLKLLPWHYKESHCWLIIFPPVKTGSSERQHPAGASLPVFSVVLLWVYWCSVSKLETLLQWCHASFWNKTWQATERRQVYKLYTGCASKKVHMALKNSTKWNTQWHYKIRWVALCSMNSRNPFYSCADLNSLLGFEITVWKEGRCSINIKPWVCIDGILAFRQRGACQGWNIKMKRWAELWIVICMQLNHCCALNKDVQCPVFPILSSLLSHFIQILPFFCLFSCLLRN